MITAGDVTKQEKLGGAGIRLAEVIAERTEYEVRTTVLGHIQRGGAPCAFDRELATRFGVKAVELIAEGKFGHVAAMENGHLVAKPIEKAIKKLKLVDPAGELVRTAKGVGIELGGSARRTSSCSPSDCTSTAVGPSRLTPASSLTCSTGARPCACSTRVSGARSTSRR